MTKCVLEGDGPVLSCINLVGDCLVGLIIFCLYRMIVQVVGDKIVPSSVDRLI